MNRLLLALGVSVALVVITSPGCLRGSKSEACEILKDCLCGDLGGGERAECIAGDNRAGLIIDIEGKSLLPSESCQVAIHQQGDSCHAGVLEVRPRAPLPDRACVHVGDCTAVPCDCEGSAAVSVGIRACVDGLCIDAQAECDRRCLMGRVVRGDPCQMLQRCRCATLFDEPALDVNNDGERDLDTCLRENDFRGEGSDKCADEATQSSTDTLKPLPANDCPDADLFVDDTREGTEAGE